MITRSRALTALLAFASYSQFARAETEETHVECTNNSEFIIPGTDLTCEDIRWYEQSRIEYCGLVDVHLNCRLSCGVCCSDDENFTFQTWDGDGISKTCDWLDEDFKKEEWCRGISADGKIIRNGCKKSCNMCRPYINVAPSASPSVTASELPSLEPSRSPSASPTKSAQPSSLPSLEPSGSPTLEPSLAPTNSPTFQPSSGPSAHPTSAPSSSPTLSIHPTLKPSSSPTISMKPTNSMKPSSLPTFSPSKSPTSKPSPSPSNSPSSKPSPSPSIKPSPSPSRTPTSTPTAIPSPTPSDFPTPNLVVIMTDEHNMRTISAYRYHLLRKYNYDRSIVDVWGDNVFLSTRNLDRLAYGGAMCENFYTVAPLCTPSRASFMTGMYPQFTGADLNHSPMYTSLKTFSQILQEQKGYKTAYLGKWHLDGDDKPGWNAPTGKDFGWDFNKYRFNRGHWKYFSEWNSNFRVREYVSKEDWIANERDPNKNDKEDFATDFLSDRAINFIRTKVQNDQHFAVFLSISDPHDPNANRSYFDTLFQDQYFKVPETANANMKRDPAPPAWMTTFDVEDFDLNNVDQAVLEYEQGNQWQHFLQQYFGMVKCIDKNVGKILDTLEELGIDEDTYVVFTSDHGDLLGEHGRRNKGQPYEMSAGIPFMIKGPKIPRYNVVNTAMASVDFAPTILSLMNVFNTEGATFHGQDMSERLISKTPTAEEENRIIFSMDTGNSPTWAMAMHTKGYKLVVGKHSIPYLFDLNKDFNELNNYIDSPEHQEIKVELQKALGEALVKHNIPMLTRVSDIFLEKPLCTNNENVLDVNGDKLLCKNLFANALCTYNQDVANHCKETCSVVVNSCPCEDSPGLIFVDGIVGTCEEVSNKCSTSAKVRKFCRKSCNQCV